jgi:N-acetylneuraminic acid mutarotase
METARAALSVVEMDGNIYAIGGAGRLAPMSVSERYSPVASIWRSLPDLPVGLEQFGLAALDGILYAAGGYPAGGKGLPGNEMWKFDEVNGEWQPAPAMPGNRASFAMVAGAGKLFTIGGSGDISGQMAVFDPAENIWQLIEGGPAARRAATADIVGGNIYLIAGGFSGAPTGKMDIYNIETGVWSKGSPLPIPRSGHANAVFAGKIHIMGGRGGGRGETLKDHWVYDPQTDEWSRLNDMLAPRTGAGAAVSGVDMYVIGGGSGGGFYASFTSMNSVEIIRLQPEF